jgi:GDP-L-fucose synthase
MTILVTGGSSMVGKHLQKVLSKAIYLSSKECDLQNLEQTSNLFKKIKPQTVIHLAAKVGGIMDNIKNPVNFFEDNILINTNTLKATYECGASKFIGVLSTCIYPDKLKKSEYPITEEMLHKGPPTPTNFAYGYAKRCLSVQIDAYNKQKKTDYSSLVPCNLYSEHDHFEGDKAHFLSSLISKIHDAKINNKKHIELFGSGKPLRQFMYAGDLANAIVKTINKKNSYNYNICTPENKSIEQIAKIALKACNAEHLNIKWDREKPDGQFRKDASSDKFLKDFPDFKFTSLFEGIQKTYSIKYNERLETERL